MTNALEKKLGKIRRFIDSSKEEIQYTALFSSENGKKLGRQIGDVMNFVNAMSFMTWPINLVQNEWISIWKKGEIPKLKKQSESTEGFEELELFLKLMSSISDQNQEVDLSKVFGRREIRRLLALLTLSSSAYLDAYLDSRISSLKESETILRLIGKYITDNEIVNGRDRTKVTEISHVWRLGSNQLIQTLYDALNIEEICQNQFMKSEIQRYRKFLTYLVRLRGKIAHGNPEPSLRKFDHELFSEIKDLLEKSISMLWQEENIPPELVNMIGIIRNWFKKHLSTMAVIFSIPLLIVLPISILDAVSELYLVDYF